MFDRLRKGVAEISNSVIIGKMSDIKDFMATIGNTKFEHALICLIPDEGELPVDAIKLMTETAKHRRDMEMKEFELKKYKTEQEFENQ